MDEQQLKFAADAVRARMRFLQENPTETSHEEIADLCAELDAIAWDLSAVQHGEDPDFH